MRMLASDPRTLFVGQSVSYDGATIYDSLDGVPMDKRLEMPVMEDFQLGYCIGLALTGVVPVCIYPRMDFMLCAMNQLVNHLDKLPLFGWKPKVILRTRVGTTWPLDAGPQHTHNYTQEFNTMTSSVMVLEARTPGDALQMYEDALACEGSVLVVEHPC
jgi:pyruvate/2-oxoglutarate/acetoin dehydrogenase E1 component